MSTHDVCNISVYDPLSQTPITFFIAGAGDTCDLLIYIGLLAYWWSISPLWFPKNASNMPALKKPLWYMPRKITKKNHTECLENFFFSCIYTLYFTSIFASKIFHHFEILFFFATFHVDFLKFCSKIMRIRDFFGRQKFWKNLTKSLAFP